MLKDATSLDQQGKAKQNCESTVSREHGDTCHESMGMSTVTAATRVSRSVFVCHKGRREDSYSLDCVAFEDLR